MKKPLSYLLAFSLLPCGLGANTHPCGLCDIVFLANNIFTFLMAVSFGAAILMSAVAGIFYLTSGGMPAWAAMAKRNLKYVWIGFAVCLSAWVMVNVLAKGVGYKGVGQHWWDLSEIECEFETKTPLGLGGDPGYKLTTDLEDKTISEDGSANFRIYLEGDGEKRDVSDDVSLAYSSVPGELVKNEDGTLSFKLAGAGTQNGTGNAGSPLSQVGFNAGLSPLQAVMLMLVLKSGIIERLLGGGGSGSLLDQLLALMFVPLEGSGQQGNGQNNNNNNNQQGQEGNSPEGNPGNYKPSVPITNSSSPIPNSAGDDYMSSFWTGISNIPDPANCITLPPYEKLSGSQLTDRIPIVVVPGVEYTRYMDYFLQQVPQYFQLQFDPIVYDNFVVRVSKKPLENPCPRDFRTILAWFIGIKSKANLCHFSGIKNPGKEWIQTAGSASADWLYEAHKYPSKATPFAGRLFICERNFADRTVDTNLSTGKIVVVHHELGHIFSLGDGTGGPMSGSFAPFNEGQKKIMIPKIQALTKRPREF